MGIKLTATRYCGGFHYAYEVRSLSNPRKRYFVTMRGMVDTPSCSCPAYQYCKQLPQSCKHIARFLNSEQFCGWVQAWSPVEYENNNLCPDCGTEVQTAQVAV